MNDSYRWLTMGVGKVCGTVATLVLSTSLLAHVACSQQQDSLSRTQAEALIAEARKLEKQNKPQQAYYRYKHVEVGYEVDDGLRSAAWKNVQRMRLLVAKQLLRYLLHLVE